MLMHTAHMLGKLQRKLQENWKELAVLGVILLIAGVAHGWNMFGFPYYENDEGVYLSQGWSLLTQGKLAPYTYWYDHAPAGWILVAGWLFLTKGVFTFGFSLNSGRVMMLVMHLASSIVVWQIGKRLTGKYWTGAMAVLIFSLSPLGIYFQRRLLLDNIMIFWALLGYLTLLAKKINLSRVLLSGSILGIAILTKENAVFFGPAYLATVWLRANPKVRLVWITEWMLVGGGVVALYLLLALLKGEFFPVGTILGGNAPHVSLVETLKYQFSRPGGSILDFQHSYFWRHFKLWTTQDIFLIAGGIIGNIAVLTLSIFKSRRAYLPLGLFGIFFWLFLIRGGIVIEFYILPLIPFLAIYIAVFIYEVCRGKTLWLVAVLLLTGTFYYKYSQVSRSFGQNNAGHYIFTSKQTQAQIDAVEWIRKNVDPRSVIIIDDYSYLEFHDPTNPSGIVFPNAHWYWKVSQDPEIKDGVLHNSPETIDYVAKTPQMQSDLDTGVASLVYEALGNSRLVKGFNTDSWGVEIWATRYPKSVLDRAWAYYKSQFLKDDRQTIDNGNGGITTSEGQSYALLRAVWSNDQATFDKVWMWTKVNMQQASGVFDWNWGKDKGTASDADEDIALALTFASQKWSNPAYLAQAKTVIGGVWNQETRTYQGKQYLIPGNWAMNTDKLEINPSYMAPYAYRIFAQIDPNHDWMGIVDTAYEVVKGCMNSNLGGNQTVYLPPNWCEMDTLGNFSRSTTPGLESTDYSYDAIRTMWRLAVDYKWFADLRADDLLVKSSAFLTEKFNSEGKLLVGYTHDGQSWENYESVLGYATNLANLAVTAPKTAQQIYSTKVLDKFYEDFDKKTSYWEDLNNYYVQNWAWFGTALYTDNLPNLWNLSPNFNSTVK